MSRAQVRHAVADWLAGGIEQIPGLRKVYKAMPMIVYGELFDSDQMSGSVAVLWLHLADSDADQWSVPAATGGIVGEHYQVMVQVGYQYLIPSADDDPSIGEDDWVDDEDAILAGIKARLRADPSLGNPAVILVAAREPGTLKVSPDEPQLLDGKVLSWHTIEFRVTEAVQA